ncbi:MAG: hypothetical protein AAB359_03195 [Elusimicrobiota bacterium]
MKKNLRYTILLLACAAVPASAAEQLKLNTLLTGGSGFWDPAFQDCMETADGYLNSKNTMNVRSDFRNFRDSVISVPAPLLKNPAPAKTQTPAAGEYVLLGVAVGEGSYDRLLTRLEAAGLRFAGEKIAHAKKSKKTVILGWAPYANIAKIAKISGVAGVLVEEKSIVISPVNLSHSDRRND